MGLLYLYLYLTKPYSLVGMVSLGQICYEFVLFNIKSQSDFLFVSMAIFQCKMLHTVRCFVGKLNKVTLKCLTFSQLCSVVLFGKYVPTYRGNVLTTHSVRKRPFKEKLEVPFSCRKVGTYSLI
jgi:hypothetical protein